MINSLNESHHPDIAMPPFVRYIVCMLLWLLLPLMSRAQRESNLWNNVKSAPKRAGNTLQKGGKKIKKWKDHLQQWGLDADYNHGFALGAHLNSNGWTGLVYYQRRIDRTKSHFFQLSFSEVKHEKQVKQERTNTAFPELGAGSPFVFGKINNLYLLQLGHGREFLILPGILDGNLSVSLRAQAGFSLAMLKPYYLKLVYLEFNPDQHAYVQEEKYSEANDEKFLNSSFILGASKWKQGLGEMTYVPGAYADVAIAIEPIRNKTFIKTVTLGGNFSIHSKSLEIMAHQKAYPWQACLYAGLSLGKRWK